MGEGSNVLENSRAAGDKPSGPRFGDKIRFRLAQTAQGLMCGAAGLRTVDGTLPCPAKSGTREANTFKSFEHLTWEEVACNPQLTENVPHNGSCTFWRGRIGGRGESPSLRRWDRCYAGLAE